MSARRLCSVILASPPGLAIRSFLQLHFDLIRTLIRMCVTSRQLFRGEMTVLQSCRFISVSWLSYKRNNTMHETLELETGYAPHLTATKEVIDTVLKFTSE
jgi:hypothetical protein